MKASALRLNIFDVFHLEYKKIGSNPPAQEKCSSAEWQRKLAEKKQITEQPLNNDDLSIESDLPGSYHSPLHYPAKNQIITYNTQGYANLIPQDEKGDNLNLYA